MFGLLKTFALLALAAAAAAAALLVPAHVRSVDPDVLEYAGARGPSLEASIRSELDSARLGPARRIARAAPLSAEFEETLDAREEELLAAKPRYALSGGPDAYFEDFLELVQRDRPARSPENGLLSVLLPRNERTILAEQLSRSDNRNVAALVAARDINGLVRLHPASHAAGAPYDAGILTLASLIQGGHFPVKTSARIGQIAEAAEFGNPTAIRELENLVIHTLSIARRLDYVSLAALAENITEFKQWARIATLFRNHPDRIPTLYAALRFSGNPEAVHDYLRQHHETAPTDLARAIREGEEAVAYLLAQDKPVYRPTGGMAPLMSRLAPHRPEFAVSLTHASASTGLWVKGAVLFLAGLFFAWAMGAAWRASFRAKGAPVSRLNPAVFARDAFISLVFLLVVWIFAEPMLLKSEEPLADTSPRIEFAGNVGLDALKSPVRIMQELNQVTLLVLALFFILQLVIYCFGLIKIREISKQKLNAETKLKLLENEEQLFDFGLYVGLGGTVLALILVAVGIVEASLMAAYASTLFGILFVAMLKVIHLRPYRRKLILEAGRGPSPSTAALMKDIEL